MQLEPGRRLDRYTLVAPIGEGGQGSVWRVHDPLNPDARFVVKVVALADVSPADAERVRAEARALAGLEHPCLVACHALFEDLKANVLGLVLDEVTGIPLNRLMADPRLQRPEREAILRHLAAVLSYVHAHGLVHRDLKPDNILVTDGFPRDPTRRETVKLVDFGIAVPGGNPHPLTRTGFTPGTVPFMPPEHIDPTYWNAPASRPTADVWAFGVLGWLLLAGHHPTGLIPTATIVDFAARLRDCHRGEASWPTGSVTGSWGSILVQCLSLPVAGRPANGTAILDMLEAGATQSTAEHQPMSGPSSTRTGRTGPVPASKPAVSSISTAPMSPATAGFRLPDQAPGARRPRVGMKQAGLAVAAAAAVGVLTFFLLGPCLPRHKSAGPTAPTRTTRLTATPAPIQPAHPTTTGCFPCCGGSSCIAVRRADGSLPPRCDVAGRVCKACSSRLPNCVPYDCDTDLSLGLNWKLRISYVADAHGDPLWKTMPGAEMCIGVSKATAKCFSITTFGTPGEPCRYRLPVTTADITSGRVSAWLKAPGRADVRVPLAHRTLGPGGLCKGWLNRIKNTWIREVGWFLDPPDDNDENCRAEERIRRP